MDEVTAECITRSFVMYTPHQIVLSNHINENGMGGACGTYGEKKTSIQGSGEEKPPPDLVVDGRMIFRSILDRSRGALDWTNLAWDRDHQGALE